MLVFVCKKFYKLVTANYDFEQPDLEEVVPTYVRGVVAKCLLFFFFKVLSNPNHSVLVNCKWYVVAQQNYWYHQKVLAV